MPRIIAKDPRYRNNDVLREDVGREILYDLLVRQHMTTYRAGQELGFSPTAIRDLAARFGVEIPDHWEEPWADTVQAKLVLRELALRFPDLNRARRQEVARWLLDNDPWCQNAGDETFFRRSPLDSPENALTVTRDRPRCAESLPQEYFLLTWAAAWAQNRTSSYHSRPVQAFFNQ